MKPTTILPSLFLGRVAKLMTPKNYQKYLASFSEPKKVTFRINTLKISIQEGLSLLRLKGLSPFPIPWCPQAFYIKDTEKKALTNTDEFKQGLIYIQNLSSIFASLALEPKPNEEILDLAAAPGGKTLHIASLMQNKGRIAAVEVVKDRFYKLKANIVQAGATNVQTYYKDGSSVWRFVPSRFDRVLLDAPCSSEGRFDIHKPKTFAYWSEKKIVEMSRKQKKLIYSAILALKSNGILLYCTCSLAPEENEAIIEYALRKFPDKLKVLPLKVPFDNFQPGLTTWQNKVFSASLQNAIRIIPNEMMAGFFICKLKKVD